MIEMLTSLRGAMVSVKTVIEKELSRYEDMIENPEKTLGPVIQGAQHMVKEKQGRQDTKERRAKRRDEKTEKALANMTPDARRHYDEKMKAFHAEGARNLVDKLSEEVSRLKEQKLMQLPPDVREKIEAKLNEFKDGRTDIQKS